jgi:hypothetical protein
MQQAWKPSLNRVLQREAAFLDELQNDRGDERLSHAFDRETVVPMGTSSRVEIRPASRAPPDSVLSFHDRDCAGSAIRRERSKQTLVRRIMDGRALNTSFSRRRAAGRSKRPDEGDERDA